MRGGNRTDRDAEHQVRLLRLLSCRRILDLTWCKMELLFFFSSVFSKPFILKLLLDLQTHYHANAESSQIRFTQLPFMWISYRIMAPCAKLSNRHWTKTINSTTDFIPASLVFSNNVLFLPQDPVQDTMLGLVNTPPDYPPICDSVSFLFSRPWHFWRVPARYL